jgi:glycosyltransferase involved in cell wall biosynthesis
LGSGGAQRLFVNIVNGLSISHEITIFLYKPNSNFFLNQISPSVSVYSLKNQKNGFRIDVLWNLRRFFNKNKVVVSFMPTANIYCSLVRIFFINRVRHISCEMSISTEYESTFIRRLANFANFISNHVICNSYCQANYIRRQVGMSHKVSTIWNGCLDLPFTIKMPTTPNNLKIVIVGRVAFPKNGYRLLQAFLIFYHRNNFLPTVSWVGRDDSDKRSRIMKQEMLKFLEENPVIAKYFNFVGENLNINAVYQHADTILIPSIYEGVPNVLCEAMLAGCIVIASRISDNEKILGSNEERGFLCNPLSPIDICLAIERRINLSSKDLIEITLKARRFAENNFSQKKMIKGYSEVISSTIYDDKNNHNV